MACQCININNFDGNTNRELTCYLKTNCNVIALKWYSRDKWTLWSYGECYVCIYVKSNP